jgi:hypothetical protein
MVIGCLSADPSDQTQPNSLGLASIVFLDRTGSMVFLDMVPPVSSDRAIGFAPE